MSCRVDTSPLIASACVVSLYPGLGISGAAMRTATATGTSGPGILYPCWDTGDDAKEFRFRLDTLPGSGAFSLFEDGSFDYPGAANGAYTAVGHLIVDGSDLGAVTANLAVGAATFAITAAGLASTLAFGTAVATFGNQFAVAGIGLPSSLAFGQATFTRTGNFAVVATGLPSSLAFGVAFAQFDGVFTPEATHPRRLVATVDPRLEGTTLPGAGGALLQPYPFSPGSRLDIEWDFRKLIGNSDSLRDYSIEWDGVAVGTFDNVAEGQGVVRAWVDIPEEAQDANRGQLICHFTTNAGRIDSRKFELLVKQL